MANNRILITGVNGFLGNALAQYCAINPTMDIVGVCRHNKKSKWVETVYADLLDPQEVFKLINTIQPQYIFHMAGGRLPDDELTFHANVTTTKNVLNALAQEKLLTTRFIIPGSAAEYGIMPSALIKEDHLAQPSSKYGQIKLAQTQLGLDFAAQGFEVMIARMFNVLGAQTPPSLAAGGFAKQIVEIEQTKEKPAVINTFNLDGRRDFCDVSDVVRGLWDIAQHGRRGEIYNVCSGNAINIRFLLEEMIRLSQCQHIAINEQKSKGSASFDVIGDYAKLRCISLWQPQVSLTESIQSALKSYRDHYENPSRP